MRSRFIHNQRCSRRVLSCGFHLLLPTMMLAVSQPAIAEAGDGPALAGYCPASYLLSGQAIKGKAEISSEYGGRVYYLASSEAKTAFDADPLKYLPQFDGLCAMSLGGIREIRTDPDPTVFHVHNGKVYLFASPRHKKAFVNTADETIAKAQKRFVGLGGLCPVSFQRSGKPVTGNPSFTFAYGGSAFNFADEEARKAFIADPERYMPKYRMYCAEGISRNIRNPGDPQFISVVNERTYVLRDAEAKKVFDANAAKLIEKADKNWAVLKDY